MRRLASLTLFLCSWLALPPQASAGDWPTFGHDPQRTGWATTERTFTTENVSDLELKWKAKVPNQGNLLFALTAPVVALDVPAGGGLKDVAYVAGKQGGVFALDSETGDVLWDWKPTAYVLPSNVGLQGSLYCPNGVIATPTFDRRSGILYTIAESGALYGLDLGSGEVRFGPVQFVTPLSKSWSLNLVGNTIYTTLAQGCGGSLGGFYSMDISDRHHPGRAAASAVEHHHGRCLGPRRSDYWRRWTRLRIDRRRADGPQLGGLLEQRRLSLARRAGN